MTCLACQRSAASGIDERDDQKICRVEKWLLFICGNTEKKMSGTKLFKEERQFSYKYCYGIKSFSLLCITCKNMSYKGM